MDPTALPPYVVINTGLPNEVTSILRRSCDPVAFPLSEADHTIIQILEAKFDQEENCSGLAAPQIGFNKRVIVFEVKDDPDLKKWRPDLQDVLAKSTWLNPSYEAMSDESHTDYEGCFSVANQAGLVKRHKVIRYEAYLPNGERVEGVATGFLARVIQHEVDHINGILFIDRVDTSQLMTLEEYRKMRREAMEGASN